ncbi:MAG: energy transducer TonB [Vicinamibacterales bacterium]
MVTLALVALLAQDPVISGDRSIVSKCEVSTDAEYGYTKDKPIRVGGTPLLGPARQRRYLQALVSPTGQAVAFARRGSLVPNAEGIILDLYEVTYTGLEKPIELYLDLYRWEPPKAPKGFACAREFGLAAPDLNPPRPPVPPGGTIPPGRTGGPLPGGNPRPPSWERMVAFAVEAGKREDLPPIPLDPYGSTRYGVAFDPFTRVARAARASGGSVPDPMRVTRFAVETLVVAFPVTCDGVTASPLDVTMVYNGRTRSRSVDVLTGGDLQKEVPDYKVPDGAIGVTMSGSTLLPGQLTIVYDRAPCNGDSKSVTLNVSRQSAPTTRVQPVWPAGVPVPPEGAVRVTVHALIDHEGVPTEIRVADGPEAFHAAAIEAMKKSRFGAHLINGVPIRGPRPVASMFVFQPPRPRPPAGRPATGDAAAPRDVSAHQLVVLSILEDPSGNRIGRAFEVEGAAHAPAGPDRVLIPWSPNR